MGDFKRQKTVVIGAGPVGALAALYAAQRGHDVEVYELRNGMCSTNFAFRHCACLFVSLTHRRRR